MTKEIAAKKVDTLKVQHEKAWEKLGRKIAATRNEISDSPVDNPVPKNPSGKLTIIGSGIETLGFTMGDEEILKNADKVFYCVADPATVAWVRELRPDAYDLYVLYNDDKIRFITYMQMSEAMLYYVRQGLNVVGVYYGHPGIFVLSTHRAIQIAKREGYSAVMKAGVCALDCLCADLSVDPCHPGMQTHEATDMLIRLRKPDTSLHVVLWQVGLIGEMGYRRKGYINHNFSIFIEYLQEFYGKDYPITHYVASRYPTIPPLIETYTLQELHQPEIQQKVTGLSTFYIAPKEITAANLEMVNKLGLIKKGQKLKKPEGPLRIIDKYSTREMKAFTHFETFQVPKDYQWQKLTAASQFIIALRKDMELQELYTKNPYLALDRFPALTPRERALLASRDGGAMQIAAKGTFSKNKPNQQFLFELINKKSVATALMGVFDSSGKNHKKKAIKDWAIKQQPELNWDKLREDLHLVNRNHLCPWTGVYVAEAAAIQICIIGSLMHNSKSYIFINKDRIHDFTFKRGILKWKMGATNTTNGFLRVDTKSGGRRQIIGAIWPAEAANPSDYNLCATEVLPGHSHLSQMVGTYTNEFHNKTIKIKSIANELVVFENDQLVKETIVLEKRMLRVGQKSFPLGAKNNLSLNGKKDIWKPLPQDIEHFIGTYIVRAGKRTIKQFELKEKTLLINNQVISNFTFNHGKLSWTNGPKGFPSGVINFLLNPILLSPVLFGKINMGASNKPIKCHGAMPVLEVGLKRIANPEFGLPSFAWDALLDISQKASLKGGLLLWHKWEKYRYTSIIMNYILGEKVL